MRINGWKKGGGASSREGSGGVCFTRANLLNGLARDEKDGDFEDIS